MKRFVKNDIVKIIRSNIMDNMTSAPDVGRMARVVMVKHSGWDYTLEFLNTTPVDVTRLGLHAANMPDGEHRYRWYNDGSLGFLDSEKDNIECDKYIADIYCNRITAIFERR